MPDFSDNNAMPKVSPAAMANYPCGIPLPSAAADPPFMPFGGFDGITPFDEFGEFGDFDQFGRRRIFHHHFHHHEHHHFFHPFGFGGQQFFGGPFGR